MSLHRHAGAVCLILITLCSCIYLLASDSANCVVSGSESADGYYFALDGRYYRRGFTTGRSLLDLFDIVSLHGHIDGRNVIELGKGGWVILDNLKQRVLFESVPNAKTDAEALYEPPKRGYMKNFYSDETNTPVKGEMAPTVEILCRGKLYEARPVGPPTNLTMALNQMGTYLVLLGLLYYAWHLRSNAVPVPEVSYSYDRVVNQGEYWRCITASISHFDIWHLGFNCFALYQMAIMEPVIGTVKYLYLSADLVLLTMVICTGMYHLIVHHAGRPDQAEAQAVGYSCVLFAWIVTVAVRMGQFCPIFFLPSFCFDTYEIPAIGMPFNLGPLVLLVATKFIIPRSSFVGHLSGIIIGLPLVWGWLDWLTPPVLISSMLSFVLYNRDLDVRKYAGYSYGAGSGTEYQELSQTSSHHQVSSAGVDDNPAPGVNNNTENIQSGRDEREFLEDFLSSEAVDRYMVLKKVSYGCVAWTTVVLVYTLGGELLESFTSLAGREEITATTIGHSARLLAIIGAVIYRSLFAYLAWSASHAKRVTLVSDNRDTMKDCILLLILSGSYSAFLLFLDLVALALLVSCWNLVEASVLGGAISLFIVLFTNVLIEALLFSAVMTNLKGLPTVERTEVLTLTKLNHVIVVED